MKRWSIGSKGKGIYTERGDEVKKLIATTLTLIVLATAIGAGFLVLGDSSAQAAADNNIVVVLKGTGLPVATPEGVVGACYETDLYDAKTDTIIGTGIDCLNTDLGTAPSFSIDRTTIFKFPQGDLVANGLTTVVPIFGASSPDFTHVVGDVDNATQNIVSGTKRFAGRTGNVRLSGIVNMASFPTSIGFNCIFIIDLD